MGLFPKWLTGFFFLFSLLIFNYFFEYETNVRSSAWSFCHSDPNPSSVNSTGRHFFSLSVFFSKHEKGSLLFSINILHHQYPLFVTDQASKVKSVLNALLCLLRGLVFSCKQENNAYYFLLINAG